jgi:transposase-like protein
MKSNGTPKSLIEAVRYFANPDVCLNFLAEIRWPNGPQCPECGAPEPGFLATRRIWKCRACRKQFSIKVGTIFEDSPIGLDKWLPCLWLIANCKNGVSSYEVGRALDVTQKTAWFMLHRIRLAMQSESFDRLSGHVEVDETYIGGRARNMHASKRERVIKGRGGIGKVAVQGLLERNSPEKHSTVRVEVVPTTRKRILQRNVRSFVEPGSTVHTDALRSYDGLEDE